MDAQTFFDNFGTLAGAPNGVHRLRDLVLRLAVRGRLVGHDPADEPADVMLRAIATEGLVTFSTLTERVTTKDALWNIPETWRWARLKEVCDFTPGRTPPTKDATFWADGGDYHWVTIGDMPDGGAVNETNRSVSAKARDEVFRGEPNPAGTILMSFKLTIGKVARLAVPAFHNEAIVSITSPFEATEEYLFRVLPLLTKTGHSKAAIMGSTLNKKSLTNLLVPVPPLVEQERIVAKVDELMGMCDNLEVRREGRKRAVTRFRASALDALTDADTADDLRRAWERISANWSTLVDDAGSIHGVRQAILQLAVQGKLSSRNPDDLPAKDLLADIAKERSELKHQKALLGVRLPALAPWLPPPPMPLGWEWTTLGSVLRHCRNGTGATPNNRGVGYRLLRISAGTSDPNGLVDLGDHKYVDMDENDAAPCILEAGDLVSCRFNGNLRFVGRVAIVPPHDGTYLHPDKLIRMKAISVDHDFLAIALNSAGTRRQIEGVASTTAGNIGINGAQLQALHIPLPPLGEQVRIAQRVRFLFDLCAELDRCIPPRDRLAEATAAALAQSMGTQSAAAPVIAR
ncbi:restriction endonuclease subunit S [Micromonospora sp. NPDC023633]|uniref:restriction endonuclease subunit S n=1 Tax=Micromonospora sp. NPDC023633 TaxID=3154320 RepID=UPI0033EB1B83